MHAMCGLSLQMPMYCNTHFTIFHILLFLPTGLTASTARPPSPTELGEPVFVHVEEGPEKDPFGLDSDSDNESTEFAQRIYSSQPFAGARGYIEYFLLFCLSGQVLLLWQTNSGVVCSSFFLSFFYKFVFSLTQAPTARNGVASTPTKTSRYWI